MIALIADVNPLTRKLLTGLLRSDCGFDTVLVAANADELRSRLADDEFGLILLDLHLEGGVSKELLKAIRSANQKCPILVLATKGDQAVADALEESGSNGTIIKPFQSAIVEKMVNRIMSLHSSRQRVAGCYRALIVDDAKAIQVLMTQLLKKRGGFAQIVAVGDGLQALEKVKEQPFDIVLLDWNMPFMDGITALREIRKIDKVTPVLMVTTEADFAHLKLAMQAGANGYIAKPFLPETLYEKIGKLLEES
jgi:two-component system chemotaxis response regulator CheY